MTVAGEEEAMDKLDVLALEMRAGFAEVRLALAEVRSETRSGLAEVRAELAEQRTQQAERQGTLLDAIADLRNEYRNHTHGD